MQLCVCVQILMERDAGNDRSGYLWGEKSRNWVVVVEMRWGRNFSLSCLEEVFTKYIYCFIEIGLNFKMLKYHLIPLLFSV